MTLLRAGYPLFLLLCLAIPGFFSIAQAETLENSVLSALESHPSAESAQAGLAVASEDKKAEYSGYFPEFLVNGSAGRIYGDNATSRGLSVTRGAGYSNLWEGQVTARQMIFDGFETSSRVGAANARKLSADMNLLDVRETLATRAAQSYLEVMRARTGYAMLKQQQKTVLDYLGRIKTSVDNGTSDEAEYQQARDVNVILDGFIADYEGQVRTAESNYFEVTGRFPEGDMEVPVPHIDLIPSTAAEALEFALASHPSLRAADFSAQSTEREVESEQAQLYPNLDGELSYLKSEKEDLIGGEIVDAKALVRMNWNFETGGGQLARIRKKRYEHEETLARAKELQRQVERGVRLAYSELQTAQSQLENSKKRQELNTKLFDTYKVQFEGARITLLQLMQADNQLLNTKLEKMNGEYRVLAAQYATLASMGRLQGSLNLASSNTGPLVHEQK